MARQLGDHGVVAVPRSLDELSRAAEDFRRQDIEVLGIAGGDGTNHVTLTHFHDVYGEQPLPTVAFLRGGTMNTVANSLGLPKGRPEGLLDRLVRRYLATPKLQSLEQRTMNIQGNLGFLWGLGVIPAFLTEYYNAGTPSPWTAVKTLSRGIASSVVKGAMIQRMSRPIEVEITLDSGEKLASRPFFSVGGGTIADIGLGFRPFYMSSGAPGHFHLQAITTTPLGFIAELARIHRAEPMTAGKSIDRLVRQIVIRTSEPGFKYMIDGDLLEHEGPELTIGVGPLVQIATMN